MSKKILMIVGSLRTNSFNRQVAEAAADVLAENGAEVSFLEYSDIPFMNQDIEFPTPEDVARVRREVMAADALWIAGPEYNGTISGALKNLLDWLSRPLEQGGSRGSTAIAGKKVTLSGIGGQGRTANAMGHLTELLGVIQADVIDGEKLRLAASSATWQTGTVNLTEEETSQLHTQAKELLNSLP